ncbi:AAA family ATPase [Nocardia sp. R16R-3T]
MSNRIRGPRDVARLMAKHADTEGAAVAAAPEGALPEPTAHCPRHQVYDNVCPTCRNYYRVQLGAVRGEDRSDRSSPRTTDPEYDADREEYFDQVVRDDSERSANDPGPVSDQAEGEAADYYVRPRTWNANDLEAARQIEWLAANRLPLAAVCYMLGPEGIGKSLWTVWLVSILTTGKPFAGFGIPPRDPMVVVLVLTEDDWSTVARPRLEIAGADLENVRVICAERDGSGAPSFPRDMDIALEACQGAGLIVVDAWADTLPASISVKDPQHARRALHPWKELATRTGVSVLLTGHTNREKGGNVRNAYGLSGEIRKKARMTILAQPDPDEDGVLVIGPEKTNLTAPVPASRFRIESVRVFDATDTSDGTVPRLVWIGDAEQSARDYFADAAAAEMGDAANDRNEIQEWLTEFLSQGSVKATEVFQAADANGFSKDQVKRAKRAINAKAERPQNPGPWFWTLPAFTVDTESREQ